MRFLQPHSNRFTEILNLFQLEQVITDPTRVTSTHESLLDIIATDRPDKLLNSGVLHIGISDHSLVYACFKVAVPKQNPKFIESRTFKHYNQDHFNRDLQDMLNKQNWSSQDPNQLWDNFKEVFILVSEIHAPITSRKVRSEYVPWMTKIIIQAMNHRGYLKKRFKKAI